MVKTPAFQREASRSFITANLQSFNKSLHGASALYQPDMDLELYILCFNAYCQL